MISSQMGLSHAGVYTIAVYIATVLEIPSRSISAIASPVAANALKDGDFQQSNALYQKVALHQLLAGGFIFLLVWINIDNIFAIIPNGSVYAEGKWVVFFVGIAKLVSITLGFGGTMIHYSKYYYWSLYFTLFIVGAGIFTNYWLIPRMGIVGAAVATLISCLLSYAVQQWIVLKKIKGNPYTRNLLKAVVLLFIGWCVNLLLMKFANPWIDGIYRTIIIVAVCALLLYLFNVSEDVNNTIRIILRRVRKVF
jgi:O-antigen/teichoic acid export membrane protein